MGAEQPGQPTSTISFPRTFGTNLAVSSSVQPGHQASPPAYCSSFSAKYSKILDFFFSCCAIFSLTLPEVSRSPLDKVYRRQRHGSRLLPSLPAGLQSNGCGERDGTALA